LVSTKLKNECEVGTDVTHWVDTRHGLLSPRNEILYSRCNCISCSERTILKSSRITLQLNPNSSCNVGQESVVGLVTHYDLDGPGIECPWGSRFSVLV